VARGWTRRLGKDVHGVAPNLVWAEDANALRGFVIARELRRAEAQLRLQLMLRLPLRILDTDSLVPVALDTALRLKLSLYDALNVVLADALDATLVTPDRRLARAATRAELIR
jgi:predicted nucleic acid-binding protein